MTHGTNVGAPVVVSVRVGTVPLHVLNGVLPVLSPHDMLNRSVPAAHPAVGVARGHA